MAYSEQDNAGLFLPTTNIWDVLPEDAEEITLDVFKELLVRLHQNINLISNTTNLKESGYYTLQEFITGKSFFPDPALNSSTPSAPVFRNGFRIVVNFGTLPNNGTKTVAHNIPNISSTYSFFDIRATATDPVNLLAFPIGNLGTTITIDATNVIITTTSDLTAYTKCLVIVEYLKQ